MWSDISVNRQCVYVYVCLFSDDLLEFPCCLQLHLSATNNLTDMNSKQVVSVHDFSYQSVIYRCVLLPFSFAKVIEQLQGILQFIVKNPSEVHVYVYLNDSAESARVASVTYVIHNTIL